jgi:hypothetical protein
MRRHALRGIHRRWHPLMRRDVRGGIWLRAVVVIGDDVDAATPLIGIDPRLGDGAAMQRSACTRMIERASPTSVTVGSARGPPRVPHPVTVRPRAGAAPGWAWSRRAGRCGAWNRRSCRQGIDGAWVKHPRR